MTQALATNTSSRTGISDLFGNRLFSTLANQSLLVSALTAFQLLLLLFALKVNKHLLLAFPRGWVLLPIFLCITLSTVRIRTEEKIIVRLWQLIGIFSATYSLLHYPLFPPMPNNLVAIGTYAFVLMFWLISASGGMFSFYLPSLAVLPPAFLVWCNRFAETITGLPITTDVDITPLNEVSICIGLGLLISHVTSQAIRLLSKRNNFRLVDSITESLASPSFTGLLLLVAISIHLANYYWSFVAKISLPGPFLTWLTENNPANMFLVALDDDHILFAGYLYVVRTLRTVGLAI